MTFQPLIPTVMTPVAVSVLTDPATGILAVGFLFNLLFA